MMAIGAIDVGLELAELVYGSNSTGWVLCCLVVVGRWLLLLVLLVLLGLLLAALLVGHGCFVLRALALLDGLLMIDCVGGSIGH